MAPPKRDPNAKPPEGPQIDFSKIMRDPEEAGRRVVRGIKRNDLYILTHSDFKKGWEARAAAVARAFPDEPSNPDFMKVFPMLAYNPILRYRPRSPHWKISLSKFDCAAFAAQFSQRRISSATQGGMTTSRRLFKHRPYGGMIEQVCLAHCPPEARIFQQYSRNLCTTIN
jgi:hypothetical protein